MLTSAVMDLAKPCIDVGLFTNRLDEMRTFYAERIGLPFEEMLPVGDGVRQYRFGLRGSVLKINHARDLLPERQPGGYARLIIADRRLPMRMGMRDPDGNELELLPPGHFDIQQIEVHLRVRDEAAFDHFYGQALGCERIGPHRFRLGETIVSFEGDAALPRAEARAAVGAAEAIASMRAVGFRYITIQVRDCDAEHRRLLAMGVSEGSPPVTLGAVARISFVRDPDGNWIEISQRASLTGSSAPD
jgi:catechol 2,3-dioxygenase-like lactoylglutathione lyase family enzyme